MANSFKSRAFGCVIVKSINSNYNADFSHQPRTLPDGTVYATDKVLKYSVRNYLKTILGERLMYFKSLDTEMKPRDLGETYEKNFGAFPKNDGKDKDAKNRAEVLKNLLTCIDVRLFGGTFAEKGANISIHGTTQITHGVNRFPENAIYSEQIASPFRNANAKSEDAMQTTLGTQFKLREGHYVHHFSVNPQNIADFVERTGGDGITDADIDKLKNGLARGCTFYDSSAKSGTENELLLWVELKEGSMLVLPSFVELIDIKEDTKRTIDLSKITEILKRPHVKAALAKVEIWFDSAATTVSGSPEGAVFHEIHQ
jgi:CRISPR-associated protein Csh2